MSTNLMPDPADLAALVPPPDRNCPFYGRSLRIVGLFSNGAGTPMALIDTRGDQCALVELRRSPCYLEIEGRPVDWRDCRIVARIRLGA
jgi:hypothetical protein